MGAPATDAGKASLPGILAVRMDEWASAGAKVPTAHVGPLEEGEDLLQSVYDCGPCGHVWDDFATVKARGAETWSKLPKMGDNLSFALRKKQEEVFEQSR